MAFPLDRSAAHAALLHYCEPFAKADIRTSSLMITNFLADFASSGLTRMGDLAEHWQPQCTYCGHGHDEHGHRSAAICAHIFNRSDGPQVPALVCPCSRFRYTEGETPAEFWKRLMDAVSTVQGA